MKRAKKVLLLRAGFIKRKQNDHPIHYSPPILLKNVQSILDGHGGYEVEVLDCWISSSSMESLVDKILHMKVDFIVASIDSSVSDSGIQLCSTIKENSNVIIVGVGSDVSERYPRYLQLNSIFDFVVRGEFELRVMQLIKELNLVDDIEKIKDKYSRGQYEDYAYVDDLNVLPVIKWREQELRNYPFIYPLKLKKRVYCAYISASRGCAHPCTFCSPTVRKSYGKKMRLRSVNRVVDEMEELQEKGANVICFEDDNFAFSAKRVLSLCEEIRKRSLYVKWIVNARIDEVTPDLMKNMKSAGCSLILFGVESGSQRIINLLKKSSSRIGWRDQAIKTFQAARKIGISTCAMFIIGNPTETNDDVEKSIQLARDLKPDIVKVHMFTLYPGSSAHKQYKNEINISPSQHHYLNATTSLSQLNSAELKKLQIRFYKKVLFNPLFLLDHIRNYSLYHLLNWQLSSELIKDTMRFLFFKNQKICSNERLNEAMA